MNSNVSIPSLGILNRKEVERKFQLTRYPPSEDIGFFVKHYWVVNWDLHDEDPHLQHVVPNPCVNMVFEKNNTGIFGPAKHKTSHLLKDKGRVFGVKFKPGGFYPFFNNRVSLLTKQRLAVSHIFAVDDEEIEESVLSRIEEGKAVQLVEQLIRSKLPERDDTIIWINQMIDKVCEDREITKVEAICDHFGIHIRKLQRMFDQYVGVSPKWVIKLYRLQNAAERMETARNDSWLQISADLGYYDQAHFIKDFKAIIGQTPDEYVRNNT